MNENNHGSTLHPIVSADMKYRGNVTFSRLVIDSRMSIKKHTVRFWYLVSKAIHFESGVNEEEYSEMYLLYDFLLNIRLHSYLLKHCYPLSEINDFIKYCELNTKQFGRRSALSIDRSIIDNIFEKRALHGLYHDEQFNITHVKRVFDNLTKKYHPQRYIGVGYKDKGSCKDYSFDGSPSWQEVSLDERFRILNNTKLRGPPELYPKDEVKYCRRKSSVSH